MQRLDWDQERGHFCSKMLMLSESRKEGTFQDQGTRLFPKDTRCAYGLLSKDLDLWLFSPNSTWARE